MMTKSNLPVHVSIIMDGNGRWAKERGKERIYGHYEGVESVRACCEAAVEEGVKYLSLYAFSEENWNRPYEEVHGLMELMAKCMENELPVFMKNGVRFVVLGNRSRLSDTLNSSVDKCMSLTSSNSVMTLILFISYSGKWDISQAVRHILSDASDMEEDARREFIDSVDDKLISSYLVTSGVPDPDLIIRTSGEQRLSNYLLWQSAYSEFFFTDVLWPDFRKEEFRHALSEYAKRDRRYGKVK